MSKCLLRVLELTNFGSVEKLWKTIPLDSSGKTGWNESNFTCDCLRDPNSHEAINDSIIRTISKIYVSFCFQHEHAKRINQPGPFTNKNWPLYHEKTRCGAYVFYFDPNQSPSEESRFVGSGESTGNTFHKPSLVSKGSYSKKGIRTLGEKKLDVPAKFTF